MYIYVSNVVDAYVMQDKQTLEFQLLFSYLFTLVAEVKPAGAKEELTVGARRPKAVKQSQQRLIALQYNFSDSENEETREERKARVVSTSSVVSLSSHHHHHLFWNILSNT